VDFGKKKEKRKILTRGVKIENRNILDMNQRVLDNKLQLKFY